MVIPHTADEPVSIESECEAGECGAIGDAMGHRALPGDENFLMETK